LKTCIGLIAGHSGDSLTDILKRKGYLVAVVGGAENEPGMDKADFVLVGDLSKHKEIINFFREHEADKVIIGTGHRKAICWRRLWRKTDLKPTSIIPKAFWPKTKSSSKRSLQN